MAASAPQMHPASPQPSQSQSHTSLNPQTTAQGGTSAEPVGYQALGNLMGGYTDTAIFRRFKNAGALDLLYRQAELQNRLDHWATIAQNDRSAAEDTIQRRFDIEFDLLCKVENLEIEPRELGAQWRAWSDVRVLLRDYHDSLLRFRQVCCLPVADQRVIRHLRTEQLEPSAAGSHHVMTGLESTLYDKLYHNDLTSIAFPDDPDVFTQFCRGHGVDLWHRMLRRTRNSGWRRVLAVLRFLGVREQQELRVPKLAEHGLQTFPFVTYSPDYILIVSRVLYATTTSILVTAAIVTLNYAPTFAGKIGFICLNNMLFVAAAAIFAKGKPGELFAVAAAYAAVLVVFASGATGLSKPPPS